LATHDDPDTIAAPVPAEYVKICQVYSSGYFFLTFNETCHRIDKYVRYYIVVGDPEGHSDVPDMLGDGFNDTYQQSGPLHNLDRSRNRARHVEDLHRDPL